MSVLTDAKAHLAKAREFLDAAELKQWDFQLTVAALRIEGGTGSPVNPLAVL